MFRQLSLLIILAFLCACQEPAQDSSSVEEKEEEPNKLSFTNTSSKSVNNHGVTFPIPDSPSTFLLRDANLFIPYQLDDLDGDGTAETVFTLISFASGESKTLNLAMGTPEYENQTQVVQTKKSLIWENNLIAYHFNLTKDSRYSMLAKKEEQLSEDVQSLKKIINPGNTLGLASPGILMSKSKYPEIARDSFATFEHYDSKDVEVLISGPVRTIFRVSYKGLRIGKDTMDLDVDHEFHAGNRWTDITIHIRQSTNNNLTFGTGIMKHPAALNFVTGPIDDFFFGYTWGKQSLNEENVGMAILAPMSQQVRSIDGGFNDSHVILMQAVDGKVNYRFMASWEPGPVGFKANPLFLKYIKQVAGQMSM